MSNYLAIIEEIKSDFQKYSDSNLIDENSLYRDIVKALKRFGNDIMLLQEAIVSVENGEAELPDNFYNLHLATLCEPIGYSKDPSVEVHSLQSSHFYKERVINTNKWDECDPCCVDKEENIIKENIYFKENKTSYYYRDIGLLKLGKSFKKSNCHSKCRNKLVRDNPREIVIIDYRLQANFEEGDIYIQYYGLPMDEDGQIDIPDTKNGHLETYIEYYLKRRLAERLIANNEDLGLSKLFPSYQQQEQIALKNASNELKMKSLTPQSLRKLRRINKLEMLQYETNLRWK